MLGSSDAQGKPFLSWSQRTCKLTQKVKLYELKKPQTIGLVCVAYEVHRIQPE